MLVINSLYNSQKQGLTFNDLNHLNNCIANDRNSEDKFEIKPK